MATQNPLHEYLSYSYHHILIACDSTDAAEALSTIHSSENTNEGQFTDLIYSQSGAKLDNIEVKNAPKNVGKYVVVINGAKDAHFSIDDANWTSVIIPETPSTSTELTQNLSMALEGSFKVVEPKGVDFLNVINQIGVLLETGPTGITWVLKTVFVGQKSTSSGPATGVISNIKPLCFFMVNVVGNFSEGGSVYEVEFVGQSNGVGKIPQYTMVEIPHVSFSSDKRSLKHVLGASFIGEQSSGDTSTKTGLRQVLQNKYDRFVEETKQTDGRKIRYEILLDKYFEDYEVDQLLISQSGTGTGGGTISFGSHVTIEHAINKIMTASSKVKQDSENDPKRIFKVLSTIRTTANEAIVTYVVRSFIVPESRILGGIPNVSVSNNVLEYDYIYTGNNVDIKKFDIRMEIGMAFFQLLETTTSLRDDQKEQQKEQNNRIEIEQTKNTTEDDTTTGTKIKGKRVVEQRNKSKRIVFPGQKVLNSFESNQRDVVYNTSFQAAISKHAAIENLEAKVVIAGNPLLLNDINTLPSNLMEDSIGDAYLANDVFTRPILCKINIMMPSTNSLTGIADGKFAKRFWYEGYYSILMVENSFNEGMFTQSLDIMSIPEN